MDKKTKIVGGIGIAALVALAGVAAHDVLEAPVYKEVVVEKNVTVEVPVEVEVVKEVEVPVNVTVEKEVIVEDETFKKLACDRLLYDDVSECEEEVEAEDAALQLAVAEIEAELAEYLDDEDVVRKDSDVRIIDIKSDFEDIEVKKSDFDDEKYVFEIDVKYEDERKDKKFTQTVTVRVEDGEAEIRDVQ